MKPICHSCGDEYSPKRKAVGYKTCLPCGETQSRQIKHTIAPLNKSNYIFVSDPRMLGQLNPKRVTLT